jgi:hypothetical protein
MPIISIRRCKTIFEPEPTAEPFKPNRCFSDKPQKQQGLPQPCVLRFGLLQDGDVGVGVFPEGKEVFVSCEPPDAGGIGIRSLRRSRLQGVGTS